MMIFIPARGIEMFLSVFQSASLNLFLFSEAAANNRRRCLWEDKCFLSSTSFLKALVLGWVSRACLIHWLKCHRDEQTIEARGQSSARTENRGKACRIMTLGSLCPVECQAWGGKDIFKMGLKLIWLQPIYWKANTPVLFLLPGQHGDRHLGV